MATGIISPALNAWTIDLSNPSYRGKALATMYIALEAGIGLGALFSGWIYYDTLARIPYIMQGTGIGVIIALIYITVWEKETFGVRGLPGKQRLPDYCMSNRCFSAW